MALKAIKMYVLISS